MRLGEMKQKIDAVLTTGNILSIKNTPLYGEQAQEVTNYGNLISALEILVKLDWNDIKAEELSLITSQIELSNSAILPLDTFNSLSSIVGRVNTKLPLYYSILESMVNDQDENIINVKLPKGINTFDELNEFNNKLSKIFKLFQFDGEFKFQGFDKGTDWYEVLITGTLFHAYFISCLQVAQSYYRTKTEFYNSAKAEIDYLAAKASNSDLSKDQYKDNWLSAFIESEVKRIHSEIQDTNGKTEAEANTTLVKATIKLVEALGDGAEFHLSLNPPQYALEKAGQLIIDYKKIRQTQALEAPKQAQLETAKK